MNVKYTKYDVNKEVSTYNKGDVIQQKHKDFKEVILLSELY
jgi:hypothetical protein